MSFRLAHALPRAARVARSGCGCGGSRAFSASALVARPSIASKTITPAFAPVLARSGDCGCSSGGCSGGSGNGRSAVLSALVLARNGDCGCSSGGCSTGGSGSGRAPVSRGNECPECSVGGCSGQ